MGNNMADDTEVISAEAETTTIVVPNVNREAKIILDWDDGQWYISNIQNADQAANASAAAVADASSGVKVAVWDEGYKYSSDDIVGLDGSLYVSQQNSNQGNDPTDGTFWWYPVVDLTNVDAVTLEGANLSEIVRLVLAGNTIGDYYKKSETDALLIKYANTVDAKKLGGLTLTEIQNNYKAFVNTAITSSANSSIEYFTDESNNSYQQSLIDIFSDAIAPDDINKF